VYSAQLLLGSVEPDRMNHDEAREGISRWLNGINASIFTAYAQQMLTRKCSLLAQKIPFLLIMISATTVIMKQNQILLKEKTLKLKISLSHCIWVLIK